MGTSWKFSGWDFAFQCWGHGFDPTCLRVWPIFFLNSENSRCCWAYKLEISYLAECKMVSRSEKKSLETSNKVKHEGEGVSCSVMSDSLDPVDCSLPSSSVYRDSPGRNSGMGCHALLQRIFLIQGSKVKHACTLLPSNCFSGHLSQRSEKAMAPHSGTLAWRIPWTEEPGGL